MQSGEFVWMTVMMIMDKKTNNKKWKKGQKIETLIRKRFVIYGMPDIQWKVTPMEKERTFWKYKISLEYNIGILWAHIYWYLVALPTGTLGILCNKEGRRYARCSFIRWAVCTEFMPSWPVRNLLTPPVSSDQLKGLPHFDIGIVIVTVHQHSHEDHGMGSTHRRLSWLGMFEQWQKKKRKDPYGLALKQKYRIEEYVKINRHTHK